MYHGYNSYVGQGAHIAPINSLERAKTVGFDHRGFCRSEGVQGYIHNEESHLSDSLKFAHMIKDLDPSVPLFCMGLSMGGLTCYNISFTHRHLFEGSILMTPAFKNVAPKWKKV